MNLCRCTVFWERCQSFRQILKGFCVPKKWKDTPISINSTHKEAPNVWGRNLDLGISSPVLICWAHYASSKLELTFHSFVHENCDQRTYPTNPESDCDQRTYPTNPESDDVLWRKTWSGAHKERWGLQSCHRVVTGPRRDHPAGSVCLFLL